jgi:hypothetical protein
MEKKETAKVLSKRNITILITLVIAVAVVIILIQFMKPERSVASYCKVYKEEDAKLANSKGETYSVAVFSHQSSNPADFASAFNRLEKVSPDEIQPDVKTLHQVFQKISDDPSQATSASLSGLGAEDAVKKWTSDNCGQ